MSTPSDQKRSRVQQPTLFELPDDPPPCPPTQAAIGRPRLRTAHREQIVVHAAPLDDLLPQDPPARIGWDSVEGLDLGPLLRRITSVEGRPGRAPIDPKILLALGLNATIEGIGSVRERDSAAVAAWRQRMGIEPAKALSKGRAATAEGVTALARGRGLLCVLVRGVAKVQAVALWDALAHHLLCAAWRRAALAGQV
jgi:hypothetical protein